MKNRETLRNRARTRYYADPDKTRAKQKEWRDRNRTRLASSWKERRRKVTLAAYGLTPVQYDELLLAQGGACALCRSTDPQHWSGRFQVDHDHQTDAVRGLLCAPCNGGLGLLGDTPERLQAALDYITAQIAAAGSDIVASFPNGYYRAS